MSLVWVLLTAVEGGQISPVAVVDNFVMLPEAPCMYPESVRLVPEALTNVEVWTTSCPKVTREDVERWRFTRDEETSFRSFRFLAVWRKKLVF